MIKSIDFTLLIEYLFFSFSAFIFNGGRFIIEMIAAKELGPEVYGVWATLLLVASYCSNSHLGIVNAVGREIPFNIAKGNLQFVEEIKITALKIVIGTIFFFSILISTYAIYQRLNGIEFISFITLIAAIFYFASQQVYQYFQYLFRSKVEFNKASLQQGVTGILLAAITIPLLYKYRLNGLIIGYAFSLLLGATLYQSGKTFTSLIETRINRKTILRLLKIGFPIMIIGFLYLGITSVDRWVVLALLGKKELGYYSFAYNIFSGGMFLLSLLANQFYPRLSLEFGKDESHKETLLLLKNQIKISALIGCLASIMMFILLPIIVQSYFESYVQSMKIAKILIIGLPFIGVALTISGYFNVIGSQRSLILPMLICVIVNLLVSVILIKFGFGSKAIACSTVFSYFIYCTFLIRQFIDISSKYC